MAFTHSQTTGCGSIMFQVVSLAVWNGPSQTTGCGSIMFSGRLSGCLTWSFTNDRLRKRYVFWSSVWHGPSQTTGCGSIMSSGRLSGCLTWFFTNNRLRKHYFFWSSVRLSDMVLHKLQAAEALCFLVICLAVW